MRKELQFKYLNYLNNRRTGKDEGFTLIELLVVIIIIGILAAIALPSLLGQAAKAKQSEARNNVGSIGRGQQAFALEATNFTTDLVELGLGIKSETVNYKYVVTGDKADAPDAVYSFGAPIKKALKAYVSVAGVSTSNASGEVLTVTATCETKEAATKSDDTVYNAAKLIKPPVNKDGEDIADCESNDLKSPTDNKAGKDGFKDLGG